MNVEALTNSEIILVVFASIVSIFLGLIAYSSTRGKAITDLAKIITDLAKEIGAVKATLEDTMSDVKELRNDIRATNASIDARAAESRQDTNSVRTEVQSVRTEVQSVRTEIQSVRTEVQSVREESAIAHEGIRGNISEVRKEFRDDINRLEDKMTDGFKEVKEILRDSHSSNKDDSNTKN